MSQTVRPEVAAFVTAVRGHLSDLSPEEVEELTGGLDADLEDRIADTFPGDPPADLGDPAAYAAELRAAAGLPPRGAGGGRRAGEPGAVKRAVHWFWAGVDELREPVVAAFSRQPWWPEFRASVVALRPVWWLVRAWVAWLLLMAVAGSSDGPLPTGFGTLVLLLLAIGISVALGRGLLDRRLRLARPGPRRILFWLNVVAVVALPFAIDQAAATHYVYINDGTNGESPDLLRGLMVDGRPVTNVFAYDAQGRPLGVVQLYDQNGRPLNVRHDPYSDAFNQQGYTDADGRPMAPFVDDRGRTRWNVFPLPAATFPEPTYGDDGQPTATASPSASVPPPPLVAVPPVTSVLGIPDGASLASGAPVTTPPTAGATASGTPSSPDASATASGRPSASPTGSSARTGPTASPTAAPTTSG